MPHEPYSGKSLWIRNLNGNCNMVLLSYTTKLYSMIIFYMYFSHLTRINLSIIELPWREENDLEWDERYLYAEVGRGNVQVYRYLIYIFDINGKILMFKDRQWNCSWMSEYSVNMFYAECFLSYTCTVSMSWWALIKSYVAILIKLAKF